MFGLMLALLISPDASTLAPQWKAGQEYLFRGTVKESGQGQGSQLFNQFNLELRVLVLSVNAGSAELIFCTKLIQQNVPNQDQAVSVYLTHAVVDARGKMTSSSAPTGLTLIVDGPATWENGFVLPVPADNSKTWEAAEPGRLPRRFTSSVNAEENTVITGEQESLDWQRPRGDSTAWRRLDKLTFSSKATLPSRVERTIERRAPAHQHVTGRIITDYQLVQQETLQGPMMEARRRDIQQLRLFMEEIATLSSVFHDRQAQAAWKRLAVRLTQFQGSSGNTPYREAVATMITTVEAGIANRLSVQQVKHETSERSVQIGQLAPHFSLTTADGQTISSQQCKGKPTLLVFLQPGSELTRSLSIDLPAWQQSFKENTFNCLLLSTTDKAGALPALNAPSGAMLKTANGRTLVATFGVSVTPYFILLDAHGTLLAGQEGWGPDTRQQMQKLLRQELAKNR